MKITIIYDNDAWDTSIAPDFGFAALIEAGGRNILFDTGAKGHLLIENMNKLKISPDSIDEIFISHDHWDHTGGLLKLLEHKPVPVYVPETISRVLPARKTVAPTPGEQIHENIYSTGTLKNIEHSLCIKQDGKVIVIAGCSHPGVDNILAAASRIGQPAALIGGLHGFSDFPALSPLELICATHCTRHKDEIKSRFPETAIDGGAGKVIEI